MSINKIQFDKGLSLNDFMFRYGTEEQCREALMEWKWADGYICPACGYHKGCRIKTRDVYQCHRCHHQTSLTAGTIFDSTRLPLGKWFLGIYLMTQCKNGISTLEMMRHLGVSYRTAWRLRHKLMEVMYERDAGRKLEGDIELDDAYLGGQRSGGKRGRGAQGKTPFLAAVEKNECQHPIHIKLSRLERFSGQEIEHWAEENLQPGSKVVTDGLACFKSIAKTGCIHESKTVGSHRQAALDPAFHWVNTTLGNIKNSLQGTFHVVFEKYAHRYLAEFQYRYNRRFDLASMFTRLAYVSTHTSPRPEWLLKLAEI